LNAHHEIERFGKCLALDIENAKSHRRRAPTRERKRLLGHVGPRQVESLQAREPCEVFTRTTSHIKDAPDIETSHKANEIFLDMSVDRTDVLHVAPGVAPQVVVIDAIIAHPISAGEVRGR